MEFYDFPFSWECHPSSQLMKSIIFQRGGKKPPTRNGSTNQVNDVKGLAWELANRIGLHNSSIKGGFMGGSIGVPPIAGW